MPILPVVLMTADLTLTELAEALGYKGITARMRRTVDALLQSGRIRTTTDPDRSSVLYTAG